MTLRAILFWMMCILGSACALWAQTPVPFAHQPVAQTALVQH